MNAIERWHSFPATKRALIAAYIGLAFMIAMVAVVLTDGPLWLFFGVAAVGFIVLRVLRYDRMRRA